MLRRVVIYLKNFKFVLIFFHSITHTYLYAHQQFNHPYPPVDPNAPVPRSSHDSKVKSGIRTGMITSCLTLSPILSSAAPASCLQAPAHNEAYPDQFSFRSAHPFPHRHPDCLDQLPWCRLPVFHACQTVSRLMWNSWNIRYLYRVCWPESS